MPELRILHVIPAVAPRYGGPSRAIFEMCRALGRRGVEVLLATTDADGGASLDVAKGEVVTYQGVPTIFFPRQWSERFGYSRPLARWLDEHLGDFDAAHIHAVFSHPCLAAARACQRRGVPYIVRPLGSLDPWSMRQRAALKKVFWHAGVGRMLRRAAAIHYTTDDERELAETSLGLRNGVVIPLGIETIEKGETADEREPDAPPGQAFAGEELAAHPYILTLSRLHPKKNLELLLEVFLSLADEFADWRLVIAGDGDSAYVESLKRFAAEHGGATRVRFAGWLDGAAKRAVLRDAALLALPSHQENFGLAAAEALTCGVPVIVSEQVNLAAAIRTSRIGWVTPLDKTSFAQALAAALGDDDERRARGERGREFAARQFSWSSLSAELERLYRTIRE